MQDYAASVCSHNSNFSVLLRNSVLTMRFTVMAVNQRTTAQSAGGGGGRRGMGVAGGGGTWQEGVRPPCTGTHQP